MKKITKNLILGLILTHLPLIWAPKHFPSVLSLLIVTLEKIATDIILGLILARFAPNLVPLSLFFFVDFDSRCYTLLQAIIVCNSK